ncbi:MAG: hypothetical protein R2849_09610 [Thermomicrobiales bacterium]
MIGAPGSRRSRTAPIPVNVSRGLVVRIDACGAGLRQTLRSIPRRPRQEPLPDDHPFWDAPGVTVIPTIPTHRPISATTSSDLFTDNLRRYIAGQPLRNVIDRERGY